MASTFIVEVITRDTCDDRVGKPKCASSFGEASGFIGVGRSASPSGDGAECAGAGAELPKDHEGRFTATEALADVGALCVFADGAEVVRAENFFDVMKLLGELEAFHGPRRPEWGLLTQGNLL